MCLLVCMSSLVQELHTRAPVLPFRKNCWFSIHKFPRYSQDRASKDRSEKKRLWRQLGKRYRDEMYA